MTVTNLQTRHLAMTGDWFSGQIRNYSSYSVEF